MPCNYASTSGIRAMSYEFMMKYIMCDSNQSTQVFGIVETYM